MSVTNYVIPLLNVPQTFEITLAGTDYLITNKWNDSDYGGWVIDIHDATGNNIVANLPLITGTDILNGLSYLGIGGSMYVLTNGSSPFDVPTLDNLGVDSNLYFQVTTSD
jgi:hypothetical protein